MSIFGWAKTTVLDAASFVKTKAGKIIDPIYVPIDKLNRGLSSSTIFVTNNLSEPIYAQVFDNSDWTYSDAIFAIGRAAVGDVSSWTGLAAAFLSIGDAGLKGLSAIDGMQKREEFLRAQSSMPEKERLEFAEKLRSSIKENSVVIPPGDSKLVHERATISLFRIAPSGIAAQASTEVSNHRLVIVSESLRKTATVNSNEDTSWVVDEKTITKAAKGDKTRKEAGGVSHQLWSIA